MRLKGISTDPGRTAWISSCMLLIRLNREEIGRSIVLAIFIFCFLLKEEAKTPYHHKAGGSEKAPRLRNGCPPAALIGLI